MKWLLIVTVISLSAYTQAQSATNGQLQPMISYQVEWIGERPLIDSSYLNMVLDKDNKAYGLAGCNYWSTTYQLKDHTLRFDQALKVTKRVCAPALMEQEHRFLKALPSVERWDFSELGQLRLWSRQGQSIKLWLEEPLTKNSK